MTGRAAWLEFALCRGTDPDLWFPKTEHQGRIERVVKRGDRDTIIPVEAQALCDACPAWKACRDHAIRHEELGIWAGTTGAQRVRLRRAAGITLRTPGYFDRAAPGPSDDDLEAIEAEDQPA